MPKRFYLASRIDRSEQADAVEKALAQHGWERTFAWSSDDPEGPEGFAQIAAEELAGVQAADVLIVLLPGGYGTHVEIGAALALGKPVILHAPDQKTLSTPYPCVFHYHQNVQILISETVDVGAILSSLPRSS
jgi:nucleoside 2-deoxyribosyltransferase